MDQLANYLKIINTVALDQVKTTVNPSAGGALEVDTALETLSLKAKDGELDGITIRDVSFTIKELVPPVPTDPTVRLTPVINRLTVDLAAGLFDRAAVALKEPIVGHAKSLINRVQLEGLQIGVKLSPKKVLRLEIDLDTLRLKYGEEDAVIIKDVSLSLLEFDLKKPQKVAMAECLVVLHRMRVEVLESLMNRAAKVGLTQAPDMVKEATVELPGSKMVVGGRVKVGVGVKFRVDLRFETRNNNFGIYFDRFYVPGTNLKLPGFSRNLLLGLIRPMEKKFKGLVEVSDEYLMIKPWPKVPVPVESNFQTFGIENGRLVIASGPVPGRTREDLDAPEREVVEAMRARVSPPGPPV